MKIREIDEEINIGYGVWLNNINIVYSGSN